MSVSVTALQRRDSEVCCSGDTPSSDIFDALGNAGWIGGGGWWLFTTFFLCHDVLNNRKKKTN